MFSFSLFTVQLEADLDSLCVYVDCEYRQSRGCLSHVDVHWSRGVKLRFRLLLTENVSVVCLTYEISLQQLEVSEKWGVKIWAEVLQLFVVISSYAPQNISFFSQMYMNISSIHWLLGLFKGDFKMMLCFVRFVNYCSASQQNILRLSNLKMMRQRYLSVFFMIVCCLVSVPESSWTLAFYILNRDSMDRLVYALTGL